MRAQKKDWSLIQRLAPFVGRSRGFVEQFLAIMSDIEHFFLGEWTMRGHAHDEMFTRVPEVTYVLL